MAGHLRIQLLSRIQGTTGSRSEEPVAILDGELAYDVSCSSIVDNRCPESLPEPLKVSTLPRNTLLACTLEVYRMLTPLIWDLEGRTVLQRRTDIFLQRFFPNLQTSDNSQSNRFFNSSSEELITSIGGTIAKDIHLTFTSIKGPAPQRAGIRH